MLDADVLAEARDRDDSGILWLHAGRPPRRGIIRISHRPIDKGRSVISAFIGGVGLNRLERPLMCLGELLAVGSQDHHALEGTIVAAVDSQNVEILLSG